jgi:hypothetical protein
MAFRNILRILILTHWYTDTEYFCLQNGNASVGDVKERVLKSSSFLNRTKSCCKYKPQGMMNYEFISWKVIWHGPKYWYLSDYKNTQTFIAYLKNIYCSVFGCGKAWSGSGHSMWFVNRLHPRRGAGSSYRCAKGRARINMKISLHI